MSAMVGTLAQSGASGFGSMTGAGIEAGADVAQGIYAKAAYGRQAQEATLEGRTALREGSAEISANDYNSGKAISSAVAARAGSGGTIDSAMPVISADYSESKIRDMYTKYSSQLVANKAFYEAKLDKFTGQKALYGSILGAAGAAMKISDPAGGGPASNMGSLSNLSVGSGGSGLSQSS
jgi:hypothetical protein